MPKESCQLVILFRNLKQLTGEKEDKQKQKPNTTHVRYTVPQTPYYKSFNKWKKNGHRCQQAASHSQSNPKEDLKMITVPKALPKLQRNV